MKTSLVSLLGGICLACSIAIAEPDATPSPSPAAASEASPSASPAIHHRHHHVLPAPSPTPSATPAARKQKRRWWQHEPASPAHSSPSATPKPSAPPEPTVQVEPTPAHHHVSTEAAPSPSATPIHRKSKSGGSWFSSLFKSHHRRTKLVPVPSPSASPTPHKRHKLPTAESSSTPGAEATPALEATAPESTPKPKPGGMSEQVPFVPPAEKPEAPENSESSQAPMVETKTPAEEEAQESSHFQAAKTRAMANPHILDLQSKADSATGDDATAATKRYYRALYDKMRDLDPSIKDRIDRAESASLRRAEQENTQ